MYFVTQINDINEQNFIEDIKTCDTVEEALSEVKKLKSENPDINYVVTVDF